MEERKLTVEEFLDSLSVVWSRIKRSDQWYELRTAKGLYDRPFVDKDGSLFGVKNAKINFYIFKEGTSVIADWTPKYLKEVYITSKLYQLPEDETEPIWGASYSEAFEQFLLNRDGCQIFRPSGAKVKKWDPTVVH